MDIIFDTDTNDIISIDYSNCIINVKKNYVYEQAELLDNLCYQRIYTICEQMSNKYKYISKIKDSHDVVSYLMIFMNYQCGQDFMKYNNGIFRSTSCKGTQIDLPLEIPEEVYKFIKIWNSFSGQYIDYSKTMETRHDILEMDAYIHITSPIRRLVDLLNIIKFQENHGLLKLSPKTYEFYNKWIIQLDYINVTMRSIRKVQNDCNLLSLCTNVPETLIKIYDGYCFDKISRNDGLYQFIIYIPELKMSSRVIIRDNLKNYQKCKCNLFIFHNEEKFKKKIRFQIL
jgi:hypothetical protein